MPRSRLLMLYTLLFVFALSVGMFVANYFGSGGVLPTGPVPAANGTSLATEIISTPTAMAATEVATPSLAPTVSELPATTVSSPVPETPTAVPPTVEPTVEQPTATSEQPSVAPEASFIEYTVQRGDTLKSIAEAHGTTVRGILDNNQIANPDSLNVGTVLRIPKT